MPHYYAPRIIILLLLCFCGVKWKSLHQFIKTVLSCDKDFCKLIPAQWVTKTVTAALLCLFETPDLSTFSDALSAIIYSSSVYASTVTRCF